MSTAFEELVLSTIDMVGEIFPMFARDVLVQGAGHNQRRNTLDTRQNIMNARIPEDHVAIANGSARHSRHRAHEEIAEFLVAVTAD